MNTGNEIEKKKEYHSIGEVSQITGIKQTVLRFWETEFNSIKPRKNKFGHRVYSMDDIESIELIKELLYKKGLTIKGAKTYLREINNDDSDKLFENDNNIKKIKKELFEILNLLKSGKNGSKK